MTPVQDINLLKKCRNLDRIILRDSPAPQYSSTRPICLSHVRYTHREGGNFATLSYLLDFSQGQKFGDINARDQFELRVSTNQALMQVPLNPPTPNIEYWQVKGWVHEPFDRSHLLQLRANE